MGKAIKRPRAPKFREKKIISDKGLDWNNWHIIDSNHKELVLVNKHSGNVRKIRLE